MLKIHKFSRHDDLAPEKCAPLCYNILFLSRSKPHLVSYITPHLCTHQRAVCSELCVKSSI